MTKDRWRNTPRDVRLAAGGPLPVSWSQLSTQQLQLRWSSALAYARRLTATAPSEAAAAAINDLVVELDQRGALLPLVAGGSREQRVAAAARRLHVTGTIVYAPGMPELLREATRDDALETVRTVIDEVTGAEDLHLAGADPWSVADLDAMIATARAAAAEAARASAATPPPLPDGPELQRWTPPPAPLAPVVDISVPHRTEVRREVGAHRAERSRTA